MINTRLTSLKIDAFRGITSPLFFDLSSPLTLIYAPNGTGKTTVCEAVEWLLTGQVERLTDSQGFNEEILTAKFLGCRRPSTVQASIFTDSLNHYVSRSADVSGSNIRYGTTAETSSFLDHEQWLGMLSPQDTLKGNTVLPVSVLMERWIKGARFLTLEALSTLIDTDEENLERRVQIFADLLGVRHLLDAEKACENFLLDINKNEISIARNIKVKQSEIAGLIDFQKGSIQGGLTLKSGSEIEFRLERVESSLNIENSSTPNVNYSPIGLRIERVEAELLAQKSELGNQYRTISRLSSLVPEVDFSDSRLKELEQSVGTKSARLSDFEKQEMARAKKISSLQIALDENETKAKQLVDFRSGTLNSFQEIISSAKSLAKQLKISDVYDLSFEELKALVSNKGRRLSSEITFSEINNLRQKAEHYKSIKTSIRQIESQIAFLRKEVISDTEFQRLTSELMSLHDAYYNNARALSDVVEPLENIRSAAIAYIRHGYTLNNIDCPVCSHQWGSSADLVSAIEKSIKKLPVELDQARSEAESLRSRISLIQERLETAKSLNVKISGFKEILLKNMEIQHELAMEFSAHGLDLNSPKRSLDIESEKIHIYKELNKFHLSAQLMGEFFPDLPSRLLANDVAVFELGSNISNIIDQVHSDLLLSTRSLRETIIQEKHAINSLRAQKSIDERELKHLKTEVSYLERRSFDFNLLWNEISRGRPWSRNAFEQAQRDHSAFESSLDAAREDVNIAKQNFQRIAAAQRADVLSAEIRTLLSSLNVLTARKATGERARLAFKNAYADASAQQLTELKTVVNPLFARMHANRVYDEIHLGHDGDSLKLVASSCDDVFSPDTDFSQGQRQDLALSIFLARARSLGGTFFMDEPVMHLDDLNRVGLLDVFRAAALETSSTVNMVITTSSKTLTRHIIDKFSSVGELDTPNGKTSALRVYQMDGNARRGVSAKLLYPNNHFGLSSN